MQFYRQFKDHNAGWKHVNQTKDPFFHLLFMMFLTFNSEFENTQSSFSCGPHFCPFWYVTYIFWPKTIWTAHHTLLEGRHPEVTKNLYYVLSTQQSQIPRTQSSCFMHTIVTHMRLPFFKFCTFLTKFSNILLFLSFFLENCMHALTFQNRP